MSEVTLCRRVLRGLGVGTMEERTFETAKKRSAVAQMYCAQVSVKIRVRTILCPYGLPQMY